MNKIHEKLRKKRIRSTHSIKQLGFSGLQSFCSRISVFLGGRTQPEIPTVSYSQPLWCQAKKEKLQPSERKYC